MWLNAACFRVHSDIPHNYVKKVAANEIVLANTSKQDSHFPIDLHCQPSQNGAEMYHGSDVIGNYLSQQIVSP